MTCWSEFFPITSQLKNGLLAPFKTKFVSHSGTALTGPIIKDNDRLTRRPPLDGLEQGPRKFGPLVLAQTERPYWMTFHVFWR